MRRVQGEMPEEGNNVRRTSGLAKQVKVKGM